MPLYDISDVTKVIIKVIDIRVKQVLGMSGNAAPPTVLPISPDRMSANGLSFFLYHIEENAHYKNQLSLAQDIPPVRFTPMALNLYYQLSPRNTGEGQDSQDIYREQLMMGAAMKALHDYPEINDSTTIDSANLFELIDLEDGLFSLRIKDKDNRIRISLLPIKYHEAVQYWTAGTSPVRLAAYYEVSVILLEPEEPQLIPGRVLQYNTVVLPSEMPRITSSRNTIKITPPDGEKPPMVAEPAQVAIGGDVEFVGTGLLGNIFNLLIYGIRWPKPALADTNWNVRVSGGTSIRATIPQTAILNGTTTNVTVLPGIYSAQWSDPSIPGKKSNQAPFTIVPTITSATESFDIVTVIGRVFKHPDLPEDDVLVYLGNTKFRFVSGAVLEAGAFSISDGLSVDGDNILTMNVSDVSPGFSLLRIIVAGAESHPVWVEIH